MTDTCNTELIADFYCMSQEDTAYKNSIYFMLQRTTIPRSSCVNNTIYLFGPNNDCSTAARLYSADMNDIDFGEAALLTGNCPNLYQAYVSTCLPNDNDVSIKIIINVKLNIIMYVVGYVYFTF